MSTSPAPSASRGDITLQPSYFTSSLYVNPIREDISCLIDVFSKQYAEIQPPCQPFTLFKKLWTETGWCWIHFKVFDARARETFLAVTERLFLERMIDTETPISRVVALFALYTFYSTQPSGSSPPLRCLRHIDVPINIYKSILALPSTLVEPDMQHLQPYATYLLATLADSHAFHILPRCELRPFNPSLLPREIFVQDGEEAAALVGLASDDTVSSSARTKKKGRPSRREKSKKAKVALVALEKYVEKSSATLPSSGFLQSDMLSARSTPEPPQVIHTLVAHPPTTTRNNYRAHKAHLLDILDPHPDAPSSSAIAEQDVTRRKALESANETLLARLREIDALAAEKGLEVGGEGGEKTGLERVEKAVKEMRERSGASPWARGGILGLLEGAGLDFDTTADEVDDEGDSGGGTDGR